MRTSSKHRRAWRRYQMYRLHEYVTNRVVKCWCVRVTWFLGEKYMGLWLDNNRHGNGIIVTIDGLYFEGTFVQNNILVGLVAPQPSAVQLFIFVLFGTSALHVSVTF